MNREFIGKDVQMAHRCENMLIFTYKGNTH